MVEATRYVVVGLLWLVMIGFVVFEVKRGLDGKKELR